jgi:hypothetical protein
MANGQPNRPSHVIPKKVVDFNPQCFGCFGYPASTIVAFKMACLTYNPSDIIIEDKEYKREEILEISTKILQFIKSRLGEQQSNPNKETINAHGRYEMNQTPYNPPSTILQGHPQMTETDKEPKTNRRTRRLMTSTTSSKFNASRVMKSNSHKESLPANISYIFTENRKRNISFLS